MRFGVVDTCSYTVEALIVDNVGATVDGAFSFSVTPYLKPIGTSGTYLPNPNNTFSTLLGGSPTYRNICWYPITNTNTGNLSIQADYGDGTEVNNYFFQTNHSHYIVLNGSQTPRDVSTWTTPVSIDGAWTTFGNKILTITINPPSDSGCSNKKVLTYTKTPSFQRWLCQNKVCTSSYVTSEQGYKTEADCELNGCEAAPVVATISQRLPKSTRTLKCCYYLTGSATGGIQPYTYEWKYGNSSTISQNKDICINSGETLSIQLKVTDRNGLTSTKTYTDSCNGLCGQTYNIVTTTYAIGNDGAKIGATTNGFPYSEEWTLNVKYKINGIDQPNLTVLQGKTVEVNRSTSGLALHEFTFEWTIDGCSTKTSVASYQEKTFWCSNGSCIESSTAPTPNNAGPFNTFNECFYSGCGDTSAPLVNITTPINLSQFDLENSTPNTPKGTASDSSGPNPAGINKVLITLKRVDDGNYWNGAIWGTLPTGIEATLSDTTQTIVNWSLPINKWPTTWVLGDYVISAKSIDNNSNQSTVKTSSVTVIDTTCYFQSSDITFETENFINQVPDNPEQFFMWQVSLIGGKDWYPSIKYKIDSGVYNTVPQILSYGNKKSFYGYMPKIGGQYNFLVQWNKSELAAHTCPINTVEGNFKIAEQICPPGPETDFAFYVNNSGGGEDNPIEDIGALLFDDPTDTSHKLILPSMPVGALHLELSIAVGSDAFGVAASVIGGSVVNKTGLTANTTYIYKLRAYDDSGNERIVIAGIETNSTSTTGGGGTTITGIVRIMEGGCVIADFATDSSLALDAALSWQIVRTGNGAVIASSDLPMGWYVTPRNDNTSIIICCPDSAVLAQDYQLKYRATGGVKVKVSFYVVEKISGASGTCEPQNVGIVSILAVTNSTIKVKLPTKPSDVLTMGLSYTSNLALPYSQWTPVNGTYTGGEEYTLTGLIELTEYFFVVNATNVVGQAQGLPVEAITLANPDAAPLVLTSITDKSVNVTWPDYANGLIKYQVYLKNMDVNNSVFTLGVEGTAVNSSSLIGNLAMNAKYQGYLTTIYPGNHTKLSSTISFLTKVTIPENPVIKNISGNRLTIQAPTWKIGWDRLDLMILVNGVWKVYDNIGSSIDIEVINLNPLTIYSFKWVAWGRYSTIDGGVTTITTPSNDLSTLAVLSPKKPNTVALNKIGPTSLSYSLPSMPERAASLKGFYTDDVSKPFAQWTELVGGTNGNLTGLTANKYYWFVAQAINSTGNNYGEITYAKTLNTGETASLILGTPVAPSIVSIGYNKFQFTAPNPWPANASHVVLEARELVEDSVAPSTNLWFVVNGMDNIRMGDVFILTDLTLKHPMNYEFRWVAEL